MSTQPLILFDRSRVTTDWRCRRRRYYGYEYHGKGLSGDGLQLELYLGSVIHDGLAAIGMEANPESIFAAAREQVFAALESPCDEEANEYANEQATLVEGLLRGFHKHAWPELRRQFPKIIAVEQEMILSLEASTSPMGRMGTQVPMQMMTKPDLIVEDIHGELWYLEYKSTSSAKDQWVNSWSSAVQLHSSIRAAEAVLGRSVVGVVVQGLYKGYQAYGKQTSPLCYAYHRKGTPPFYSDEWAYEYRAGLKKYPVWQRPGGIAKWVEEMPTRILAEQFPQVPPIFINNSQIDAFFRQTIDREKEIWMASQAILHGGNEELNQQVLDMAFPQNFSDCSPSFGHACPYKKICFGPPNREPLSMGYVYRTPHHQPEIDYWQAQENDLQSEMDGTTNVTTQGNPHPDQDTAGDVRTSPPT